MTIESSVIVETQIPGRDGKKRWCAVEVRYRGLEDRVDFGMPEAISLPLGPQRSDLQLLLCAMLTGKGEFFSQVSRAVVLDEKRRQKRKKRDG
jgi:hypothetical protein